MTSAVHIFTKARLAGMLGVKSQTVAYFLRLTPPSGHVDVTDDAGAVRARNVDAWTFDDLPAELQRRIEEEGRRLGFMNGRAFVESNVQPWPPRIPLNEVAPECKRKAEQLRRALTPSMERKNCTHLSASEFEALGVADYERETGERITPRYWRSLLKRTLQRDGGRENWQRLEIYLPERLQRAPTPAAGSARQVITPACEFSALRATLALVADKQNPTLKEIDLLWEAALNDHEAQCEQVANPARLKRAVIEALMNGAAVAKSFHSARMSFDVKRKAWIAGGMTLAAIANKKLRDNRPAPAPSATDVTNAELLAFVAGEQFDGMLAPARRELARRGVLPPTNSRSKSYVEPRFRRLAIQDARIVAANKRGARAVREMVPTLICDPSKVCANDVHTFDDGTLPVLWYVPDGNGWFTLVQGQCLIAVDWRSWRILAFSLQPDRQYDSMVIRTLFNKTWREHNLPKRIILEGGIWRTSRLIKGNDASRKTAEMEGVPHTDGEIVYGLESQLGIKITHAISPTGKAQVESVFRLVQDLMWREKGYCGRDQRKDLPDDVKRHRYEVESRQAHPSKYFYSFAEWEQRLAEIFAEYNATPQQGQWLNNESPDEAFAKYQNTDDPPIAFNAFCQHLLCSQIAERTLRPDHSITFEIGRKVFKFFSADTIKIPAGTRVLTFFDPALPDSIVLTDLKKQNAIVVPRSDRTSLDTEDQTTQRELGKKKQCASYIGARFRTLAAKHKAVARTPLVSEETAKLEAQITTQRAERTTAQRTRESLQRKGARLCEELGLPPALARGATAEQVQGWQEMVQAQRGAMEEQP